MNINVTAEDIQDGEPGVPCACAIAVAARRSGLKHVAVRRKQISWWEGPVHNGGKHIVCDLPPEATAFIDAYDNSRRVSPFSFTINPEQ